MGAQAIIDFHVTVMNDETAPLAERQRSAQFLWDNGLGKAPQAIDISQETKHSLSDEFKDFVRQLNDRSNTTLQDYQREKAMEITVDFSELD